MYLTGRTPLLVAVGTVPVVLLSLAGVDAWLAVAGWLAVCVIAVLADAALAPDPRRVSVERRMPRRVLLGEPAVAEVGLRNTGSRTLRGRFRDAWQPTAGAPDERVPVVIPPGDGGFAEPRHLLQALLRSVQRLAEATELGEDCFGQRLGIAARQGAEQDQLEQLVVGKRIGASLAEALPQPFAVAEIVWLGGGILEAH